MKLDVWPRPKFALYFSNLLIGEVFTLLVNILIVHRRQRKLWFTLRKDFTYNIYVVVQFHSWYKFYSLLPLWGMIMYNNEIYTKENEIYLTN